MNGILEQLLAAIQANTAAVQAMTGVRDVSVGQGVVGNAGGGSTTGSLAQVAASAAPATVTADQLTALIMPHIANENIKAALGVAMRANGVANLPEAQPHQYPTLYTAFQQVLAAHGVGGPAPVAPAANASII